jgi:hypothetical protein
MDDSEKSHFDDGDDEHERETPPFADGTVDFFSALPGDEYSAGETALDAAGGTGHEGTGHEDDRWWQQPSSSAEQVPFAATILIAELLDDPFGLDLAGELMLREGGVDFAGGGSAFAGQAGPGHAMSLEGGAALLQNHGIDAQVEHGDVATLERYVQEGRSVILTVAADELSRTPDPDSRAADQALIVTGIDTDAGVAIAHDPRDPATHAYHIPIDALEEAWADSGNAMLVAEIPAHELLEGKGDAAANADPSSSIEGATGADAQAERIRAWGSAGAAILPVLLGGAALMRRRKRV